MSATIIASAILGILIGVGGFYLYQHFSAPKRISGEQFAAMLESQLPRTSIPRLGSFHLNNGSWWQDTPTVKTPDGKPLRVLFDSPDAASHANPSTRQITLLHEIEQRLPELWPDMEQSFREYLREMDDSGRFEDSAEWEVSVESEPSEGEHPWTISFKIPGGHAAWYQRYYRNFDADVTYGTY